MTKRQRRTATMVVCASAAFAVIGVWAMRTQEQIFEVEGTITSIDVAQGAVTVEFIDPRNGHLKETARPIPDDCVVTLNGVPAKLGELMPGDKAHVKASYHLRTKQLTPLLLAVDRNDVPHASASGSAQVTHSHAVTQSDASAGN